MRLALLTEYTRIGGGESNLLNLAEELNKYIEVTIFCGGDVKKEAQKRNINTEEFSISHRWFKGILFPKYDKTLINRLNSFDIVHSYSINPVSLFPFIKSKKVLTIHGFWERPYGLRAKIIEKFTDKVITVSTDVYNITKVKNKEKIFLGTKIENCQKEELDFKKVKIACIGRFQEIKGQDILLNALKIVSDNVSFPIEVAFIGDVNSKNKKDIEFKQKVLFLAKKLNNPKLKINFLGFQNDVKKYISKSHLVVVPSRYESFSMVSIEALSCQTPVIAPKIGGLKDIIDSDKMGLLFEPENIKDLAQKIIYAIENYDGFDKNQIKKRSEDFSIQVQAKKHLKLYKELLSG